MPVETADEAGQSVEGFRLGRRGWSLLAAGAVLAWWSALLLWAQHGIDEAALLGSASLDAGALPIGLARAASRYGTPLMGVILLVGLVASVQLESRRPMRPVFLLTVVSLAVSGGAGDLLKELVERPRPYIQYPSLVLPAGESTTWSFPSGHSTKSVALALPFLLFVRGRRGWPGAVRYALIVLAVSVCASRVVLGAHFPSDVLGGLAMALSGLPLAMLATNAILVRMMPSDLDRAGRIWIGVYVVLVFVLLKLS